MAEKKFGEFFYKFFFQKIFLTAEKISFFILSKKWKKRLGII